MDDGLEIAMSCLVDGCTIEEAIEFSGESADTVGILRDLVASAVMHAISENEERAKACQALMAVPVRKPRKRCLPVAKALPLLLAGVKVKDIAARLGCTVDTIYKIRAKHAKGLKKRSSVG